MSASPHPRLEQRTNPSIEALSVPYNSADLNMQPQGGTAAMSETWKRWEGKVVNGEFPLQQYLGGSDHSAVFLTQRGGPDGQKAAIKLIPADPETAERRLFQWRVAAKLLHPHLLHLYESGRWELDGTPLLYVVMEFAEEDLSQIIPQRPLTPAETREMLRPVLDGLASVHSKNFIHGRIRPTNILAVADQVKLATDHLSAVSDQVINPGKNLPGKIAAYDAPETVGGKPLPASDIWSLGVTLVEVLTQQLPKQELRDPVPAGIPDPFREIAHRCLRQNPQDRWSVSEIAASLEQSLSARKPAAASANKTSTNWSKISIIAGVIALTLVVGSKLRTSSKPEFSEAPQPEVSHSTTAASAQTAKPVSKPNPVTPAAVKPKVAIPAPVEAKPLAKAKPATGITAPGAVAQQVLPKVSESARATITGKVRVTVKASADPSGNVTEATLDNAGPSKYFARLALEAARQWKFTPPQVNGRPVSSTWKLRFAYSSRATEVSPSQTAP